jgi:beta-glucosidase/6-phospho-beta-glucosidase/beta-galactosidase
VSGWEWGEVYPQGIGRIADALKGTGKPLYVTESGVADRADRLRPWVLAAAAKAMHDAIGRGADIRGYLHWTLVDNFEWSEGFSTRFGLYALDVETQARTARPSAGLFRQMAQENGVTREMLRPFGSEVEAAAFGP